MKAAQTNSPPTPGAPGRGKGKGGKSVFDGTFFSMLALLVVLTALAYSQGGTELVKDGLGGGFGMLQKFALLFVVAFLVAGLVEKLIPHETVSRLLGEESGWRGLLIATAAGMLTPSGPFISFPVAATLLKSGASTAAVVTYVAAWMLLAVHRFFIWEIPFLGTQTAILRWGVCLVLPILAGLATRVIAK
jgi:uncharacterized membrane protein YraQ (UPF0718 family)